MNEQDNILPEDAGKEKLLHDLDDDRSLAGEESFPEADFEKDAEEGLSQMPDNRIPILVEQLNANLRQQVKKKKRRRGALPDQRNVYFAIIIILLLIVLAWIVMRKIHS